MLTSDEQMHIIKTAIQNGYKGPIYKLIEQAIVEKGSTVEKDPEAPQAGTPALGGKIPGDDPTSSTERNIIRPGQYKDGGKKNSQKIKGTRTGSRPNNDGSSSTHLMADNNIDEAWPTLFQDTLGKWIEPPNAYDFAKQRGEVYKFDSKEELKRFSRQGDWKATYSDLPEDGSWGTTSSETYHKKDGGFNDGDKDDKDNEFDRIVSDHDKTWEYARKEDSFYTRKIGDEEWLKTAGKVSGAIATKVFKEKKEEEKVVKPTLQLDNDFLSPNVAVPDATRVDLVSPQLKIEKIITTNPKAKENIEKIIEKKEQERKVEVEKQQTLKDKEPESTTEKTTSYTDSILSSINKAIDNIGDNIYKAADTAGDIFKEGMEFKDEVIEDASDLYNAAADHTSSTVNFISNRVKKLKQAYRKHTKTDTASQERLAQSGIVVNSQTGEAIITDRNGNVRKERIIVGKNTDRATGNPVPYAAILSKIKDDEEVFVLGSWMSKAEAKDLYYSEYGGGTTPLGAYTIQGGKLTSGIAGGYTPDQGYPENSSGFLNPIDAFGEEAPTSRNYVKVRAPDGTIRRVSSSAAIHPIPKKQRNKRQSAIDSGGDTNFSAGCIQFGECTHQEISAMINNPALGVDTVQILNPSIVADHTDMWNNANKRMNKTGGFKYSKGGVNKTSIDPEESEDYEGYTMDLEMEGSSNYGKSPVSYAEFEKLVKKHGLDVAKKYYQGEGGNSTLSFNDYIANPTRKQLKWEQVGSLNEKQKTKYYKTMFPNAKKRSVQVAFDQKNITAKDVNDKKFGLGIYDPQYIASQSKPSAAAKSIDSELSIADEEFMATPETFEERGAWSGANLKAYGEEWNSGDRVEGNYTFMDYWKNKKDTRTFKPKHFYGDDRNNDKIFYADEKGNPIGDKYTDGTLYTDLLKSRKGYNQKGSSVVPGSAEALQSKYEFGEGVVYKGIPAIAAGGAALAAAPYVLPPVVEAASVNLIPGVVGTSTFDALGAYGVYDAVAHGEERLDAFKENPGFGTGVDLAGTALGGLGGAFTGTRLLSNVTNANKAKTTANQYNNLVNLSKTSPSTSAADDIVKAVSNKSKFTQATVSRNAVNNPKITSSNAGLIDDPNVITQNIDEIIPDDGGIAAMKHVKTFAERNFEDPLNQIRLDKLDDATAKNIRQTYKQNKEMGNYPYMVNEDATSMKINKSTWGHSAHFTPSAQGHVYDPLSRVVPTGEMFLGKSTHGYKLGTESTFPRASRVFKNNTSINHNTKEALTETERWNKRITTGYHEWDHTTKMPLDDLYLSDKGYPIGSMTDNFKLTTGEFPNGTYSKHILNPNKLVENTTTKITNNNNSLALMTRDGIIDGTAISQKSKQMTFNGTVNSQTGQFNTTTVKPETRSLLDRIRGKKSPEQTQLNKLKELESYSGPDGFDNYLQYVESGEEMGANMSAFRIRNNLNIAQNSNISSARAKELFAIMKKQDPEFHALFKNSEAFRKLQNVYPYAVAPVAAGLGIEEKDDRTSMPKKQKKGGYRSVSAKRMLYSNTNFKK